MRSLTLILKKIGEFTLDIFAPPRCVICGCAIHKNLGLCPDCLKIYEKAKRKRCGICLKQAVNCSCRPMLLSETDSVVDKSLISLLYLAQSDSKKIEDKLSRKFVYHFKRNMDRASVPFAARELAHEFLLLLKREDIKLDDWIITNPPRSKNQRLIYGFDHAEELARKLSELTGIKYQQFLNRNTHKMQKTLNAFQRRANANKAYAIKDDVELKGKKILIVDDVITTGATLNACAHILKENGAEIVFPMSIARTRKNPVNARRALTWSTWFNENKSKKRR